MIDAGAVVTKSLPPYSVYLGVPVAKMYPRFSEDQIMEHEHALLDKGECPDSMLGK